MQNKHSLIWQNNALTVSGVQKVSEIDDKQAQLKLESGVLTVKGSGLSIVQLNKEQGSVVLEATSLTSLTYRNGSLGKGLFS